MPFDPAEPFLIADHPALDLLNTVSQVDGQLQDEWRTGQDVRVWFGRVGMALGLPAECNDSELLARVRCLRETLGVLIRARHAGEVSDPTVLNGFLRHAAHYPHLDWPTEGAPSLRQVGLQASLGRALAPLAEAGAWLLAEGDFRRVRQCEHPDCILWFYDRTKANRRRWCSMALCGNRHKVAEHRKRQKQAL